MKIISESLNEFQKGLDPVRSMGLGKKAMIDDWFKKYRPNDNYKINPDNSIDIFNDFSVYWALKSDFYLPEYIKLNKIHGNFDITYCDNITKESLPQLPKFVAGDFTFFRNGVKLSEKYLKDNCKVLGTITLLDYRSKQKQISTKKYNKRGPISKRTQHEFPNIEYERYENFPSYHKIIDLKTEFSKGYKLYKALQFIAKFGEDGVNRKDIVKYVYEITYGKGSYTPNKRSWWTEYFNKGGGMWYNKPRGFIARNTDRTKDGKYKINSEGLETIEKYKQKFNE